MKKKAFLLNAVILTATSLLARVMGIAFRVYMSNKIGAEGIGLYQLIGTVYLFCANFATTGISITVTRLVTDSVANKEFTKAKRYTRYCLLLSVFISCAVGGLLFCYADLIGTQFLHDDRTVLSLKVLAPSLPFMAVSSTYRGYFYASRQVFKTASEQLIEQVVEIVVFAAVVGVMAPKGLSYACCSIVVGTTAAEVLSCIYSFIMYRIGLLQSQKDDGPSRGMIKKIASIAIPITGSYCLRSGLSMIENVLIPSGLKKAGASSQRSLAAYGMIMGMVMPVIAFPSVFLYSFSMLLIPEMSEANAVGNKNNIHHVATRVFQIAGLFSIMVAGIFFFFGEDLGYIIYGSREPGIYIKVLAPIVPLMYLDSVVDGMLKGLGEQVHYLSYNIIDSTLRVILIYFLLPIKGIEGLLVVMFVSTILNSSLSMGRLIKVTKMNLDVKNWIIKPVAAIVSSCLLFHFILTKTAALFSSFTAVSFWGITAAVIFYFLFLFFTKGISKEDVVWFKSCLSRK